MKEDPEKIKAEYDLEFRAKEMLYADKQAERDKEVVRFRTHAH